MAAFSLKVIWASKRLVRWLAERVVFVQACAWRWSGIAQHNPMKQTARMTFSGIHRRKRRINRDFPYGFLPTTSVELFCNFLLLHRFARTFSSPLGFSLAQVMICRQLCLSTHFSMPSEDTSPVVSIVFMGVLSLFLHPDIAVANLSRPIRSKIVWNNLKRN